MKPYVQSILILVLIVPLWMNAQVFPAQVTPQVLPPYSLKLSEYGTGTSEKLIVNLLFTDITESNVQVRLKFFLENNAGLSIQSSDVVVGANPIVLDGGVPLRLTNIDLQAYFSFQNLLGISPQQYNAPLPEGLYRFCFELYDVFSGQRISRKSCVPVYLVLNDPPFLNIPSRGEQVLLREPQNTIFQWTPRHLNATNVSYEFTLAEIWDTQMDPQAAFLASRPLYQTNTFATTLLYSPAEPQLLPDKKYGWRVRAMVSDGISETSVFKNDGYSEIYYFTYTGKCAEPEAILSEAKNNTSEKIYWKGVAHRRYKVEYRKKNPPSENTKKRTADTWFKAETLNETTTIYNLEPGTTYQFRVGGQCLENGPYTYSQIYEFTTTLPTSNDTTFNCEIPPEIVITNQESIQQLVINESFTAGDFPVTIKEITVGNDTYQITIPEEPDEDEEDEENAAPSEEIFESGNQEKTFSGWGYIVVPYLNDTRIKVSFENIKINTDYQLIDGVVETDYDKNWGGLASVNDILDVFEGDNDVRTINLDYDITIDDISIAEDGTTIEIRHPESGVPRTEPGGDDVTIIDRSGDIFHVDADGNIREGGQMAQGGPISSQNTTGVNNNGDVTALTAQGIKVDFLEYTDYAYGFDGMPSGQEKVLGKYYKKIKDTQGKQYAIINKSVGNGDTDIIRARVTITDPKVSINDLVIKTIHGENVAYTIEGDGIIKLQLKGYYAFEHENIYATIQPKNTSGQQTIAGVFSQWHLANKDVNVTIVPVNGASLPSGDGLGAQINKIFKQASVTFNVTIAPEMTIGKSQIGVGASGALSSYTSDQKELINTFKSGRSIDRKSYYVFVFGNSIRPSRPSVAGFMPLKRQFGFVFLGNLSQREEGKSSLAGTLAHEFGHGAFALQHPFKKLGTSQAGTDWLMDYGTGMRLSHIDWAQIHNPEFRLYLFQDGEDGALTVSVIAPNGTPITYEGEGAMVFTEDTPQYSNGAVFAILENDRLYEWDATRGDYRYEDKYISNLTVAPDNTMVQLYWHKGSCDTNEIYETNYTTIKQNHLANGNLQLNLNVSRENLSENIVYVGKSECFTENDCANVIVLQSEIDTLKAISNGITISSNMDMESSDNLIQQVNALNICGLKKLSYEEVSKLLIMAMLQENFDSENQTEKAILKLMELIPIDKGIDFIKKARSIKGGLPLKNSIAQAKNINFSIIPNNTDAIFITNLIEMTYEMSDGSKWNLFNDIIKYKFNSLEDRLIIEAIEKLLTSLSGQNENQIAQIPSVLNLFVEMLSDPNITNSLDNYKIIYDIATLRSIYAEQFRQFTVADYLILIKNADYNPRLSTSNDTTLKTTINQDAISWLLPSSNFREYINRNLSLYSGNHREYILEGNYLLNRSFWHRHTASISFASLINDIPNLLEMFHEQLLGYIEINSLSNDKFWDSITNVTCDNIEEVIKHINEKESTQSLQNVSGSLKLTFVKAYFNDACRNSLMRIDYVSNNINALNVLMKVLSSFSANDQTILETLERISIEKIEDKLEATEFDEFVVWFGIQILTSERIKDKIIPRNLALDDKDRFYQLEANLFQFQNLRGSLTGNRISVGGTSMAYNQLVLVHVRGTFTFLGQTYKQGDVLLIPLIQAYAMSENNQSTVVWNSLFLTLDVASVLIPIAGGAFKLFRLAGHTVQKTILATDITASTASAVVTSLNADVISAELRFKIQIAALATSVPSLFTSFPQRELDALRNRIDMDLDDLTISSTSRKLLKSSYRTSEGVSTTKIPGVPDELADAFKADFPNLIRADELDEDFFKGWVNYRTRHPNTVICH